MEEFLHLERKKERKQQTNKTKKKKLWKLSESQSLPVASSFCILKTPKKKSPTEEEEEEEEGEATQKQNPILGFVV